MTVSGKSIREEDIITRIQQGMANKEIAADLGKSTERIKDYIHKLLRKYHCKNRTELAIKFKEVV